MARISLELPDDLAAKLTRVAEDRQCTREQVLMDAAQSLVAEYDEVAEVVGNGQAFRAWIAEGEADFAAGRSVSFEEAMDKVDAIIARARTKP